MWWWWGGLWQMVLLHALLAFCQGTAREGRKALSAPACPLPPRPALSHPTPLPPCPQASGKLDKFLEKRRKKNAAKDHRYLPSSRRQAGGED